ncbi:MAG: serine hydrolase domain-containing protein [Acidimicrobiales bacterium]|nr:serine hydrolase domain-containing protein [Acidimicrobiales bacterium]
MTDGLSGLAGWPGTHRAAGWLAADGRAATAGEIDRSFRLASVTKLLTATAVLVAVQEEIVHLDEPAGPPDATVRLLLCHASGLPFDGSKPIAAPGTRRVYGNPAFELLGELVAERAGLPFHQYTAAAVLQPLGMAGTDCVGSPAHGSSTTLPDLLRFADELLHPGRVLAPETLASAITPQLPELAGVLPGFGRQDPNPWGLGFELHGEKAPHWMPPGSSPRTFGHFGQSGAFLWVDPDAGVACAALTYEPFGDWAATAWPALGGEVLAAASPTPDL